VNEVIEQINEENRNLQEREHALRAQEEAMSNQKKELFKGWDKFTEKIFELISDRKQLNEKERELITRESKI